MGNALVDGYNKISRRAFQNAHAHRAPAPSRVVVCIGENQARDCPRTIPLRPRCHSGTILHPPDGHLHARADRRSTTRTHARAHRRLRPLGDPPNPPPHRIYPYMHVKRRKKRKKEGRRLSPLQSTCQEDDQGRVAPEAFCEKGLWGWSDSHYICSWQFVFSLCCLGGNLIVSNQTRPDLHDMCGFDRPPPGAARRLQSAF